MTKPFHSMSDDFDELVTDTIEQVKEFCDPNKTMAMPPEASKPSEYIHHEMISETHCRSFAVVEKSAHDALKAELDIANETQACVALELEETWAENERLKALLGEPGEGNRYRKMLIEHGQLRQEANKLAEALRKYQHVTGFNGPASQVLTRWKEFIDGK